MEGIESYYGFVRSDKQQVSSSYIGLGMLVIASSYSNRLFNGNYTILDIGNGSRITIRQNF
jgi:hypothetical protein